MPQTDLVHDPLEEVAAKKRPIELPDLDLDDGVLTDQEKYYSIDAMNREWERLWTKVWTIAGRVSDLKKVGDWFTFELGRESFIIVRSARDRIQAFYNVCQHRGSRLVDTDFGHSHSFVCSYHAWAWKIDGSLKHISDEETFPEKSICGDLGLSEVKCDSWGGFVFINMDDNAAPLSEFLAGISDDLAVYKLDEMTYAKDYTVDWPVNWKIGLEAFMEGYHAHARHPELVRMIDDFNFEYVFFGNGHNKNFIPMWTKSPRIADRSGLTNELRLSIEATGLDPKDFEGRQSEVRAAVLAARRQWAEKFDIDLSGMTETQILDDGNYSLFPNVTLNAHPEGVLVMSFKPHASEPDRCRYDVWVIARPNNHPEFRLPFYMAVDPEVDLSEGAKRPARRYLEHGEEGLGLVLDQDGEALPLVQAGVQSRGFKGVRLSDQEVRLRYFYREYDRYLGESA